MPTKLINRGSQHQRARRWSARIPGRRAAAVVETALLMPLLVLLAFGSIELSNMVFLKQSLSIAAYEGARMVTHPGATQAQADTRIREVLAARNVTSYTVTYSTTGGNPITVTPITPRGTLLNITVRSSNGGANYGPLRMFTGRTLQCQTTMVRQ
ncbi:MAG: pilus assembly protein [Pirellulaceae bacterium]|nr:pilus assembly protein [Pirellulaceae bacterium]